MSFPWTSCKCPRWRGNSRALCSWARVCVAASGGHPLTEVSSAGQCGESSRWRCAEHSSPSPAHEGGKPDLPALGGPSLEQDWAHMGASPCT